MLEIKEYFIESLDNAIEAENSELVQKLIEESSKCGSLDAGECKDLVNYIRERILISPIMLENDVREYQIVEDED